MRFLILASALFTASPLHAECPDNVKQAAVEATAQMTDAIEAAGYKVSFDDMRKLYEDFLADVNSCEEKQDAH
jgi:hypothetical protein